jgi:hypothetical protein
MCRLICGKLTRKVNGSAAVMFLRLPPSKVRQREIYESGSRLYKLARASIDTPAQILATIRLDRKQPTQGRPVAGGRGDGGGLPT